MDIKHRRRKRGKSRRDVERKEKRNGGGNTN